MEKVGTTVMKHANIVKYIASNPHTKAIRLQFSKQLPRPTMPEAWESLVGQQQKQAMICASFFKFKYFFFGYFDLENILLDNKTK